MLGEVEQEIAKLQRVADALRGTGPKQRRAGAEGHGLSAAARRKISLAQKARWAKQRGNGPSQKPQKKRTMSAEARKRISAAQRARWAKVKAKT